MATALDHQHMARALVLAARGRYTTHPNPRVGCVVVAGDQVVGEGWHMRAGEPHAEIYALRQAGDRAGGATVYVTLEPCCHHGRTAPCTGALIAAGVRRVVVAMTDPNPKVAGQGLEQLREAGIDVDLGVGEAVASQLNTGYIMRRQLGRPRVRVKLAMSLDGRTAMASGESRWITGEAARRDVHRLRAEVGTIVTGIGTVLADNPAFTVRLPGGHVDAEGKPYDWRQPARVVLDSQCRSPATAAIFDDHGAILFTSKLAASQQPTSQWAGPEHGAVEVCAVDQGQDGLDLHIILAELARREVNDVLVEAGPRLAGGFLAAQLVDELIIYMAPTLLGNQSRGLVHVPGLERLADRIDLRIQEIRAVGVDWRITAQPIAKKEA